MESENPPLEKIISAADPYIDYSQIKRIIMIRPRSSGELGMGGNSFVNYTTNEGTTTVKDEYMPRWVVRKPGVRASNRIMFYSGQGEIEEKVVTTQTIDVVVHALESSVVQINTVYYPGWGATLDNEPVSIQYKNDQGLIRISVPPGDHRLIASFRETISRFVADGVSLAFLVWYMVTIVRHKRKK